MTQSIEQVRSRLANVEAIQPLLSALRTMSMGAWQSSLKKIEHLDDYENNYDHILYEVLPHVNLNDTKSKTSLPNPPGFSEHIFLIVGTERGLCGKFNISLAENALSYINQLVDNSYQLWVIGSRLIREFERRKIPISWKMHLSGSGLISYRQSYELTQMWLEKYEAFEFNQFSILHNQPIPGSAFEFAMHKLLPFEIVSDDIESSRSQKEHWPPVLIETDATGIYRQVIQQFVSINLYKILLKSMAAEHSARYYLMQEASDNSEDIIEELTRLINMERKRKITQEMQELAVGAGLLDHH